MNKKKKIANKKHRKTRERLKQLKVISLSKMKKKVAPKKDVSDIAEKEVAAKTTTKKTTTKKTAAKKTATKKTAAKKTATKKTATKK